MEWKLIAIKAHKVLKPFFLFFLICLRLNTLPFTVSQISSKSLVSLFGSAFLLHTLTYCTACALFQPQVTHTNCVAVRAFKFSGNVWEYRKDLCYRNILQWIFIYKIKRNALLYYPIFLQTIFIACQTSGRLPFNRLAATERQHHSIISLDAGSELI